MGFRARSVSIVVEVESYMGAGLIFRNFCVFIIIKKKPESCTLKITAVDSREFFDWLWRGWRCWRRRLHEIGHRVNISDEALMIIINHLFVVIRGLDVVKSNFRLLLANCES